MDATLSTDDDGELCLRLLLPMSKTDQYNEGHAKTLKTCDHPLCPVLGYARRVTMRRETSNDDDLVFSSPIRKLLPRTLKLAAVSFGMGHTRISNHSLRAGGASQMFAVGFEMEIIKRWGRWVSTTFHQYIWRDEQVLSGIGRGVMSNFHNHGRAGGKRTRYHTVEEQNAHRRLVERSMCMSASLRRKNLPGMTREGWAPTRTVLGLKGLVDRHATFADIFDIVEGGWGKITKIVSRLTAISVLSDVHRGIQSGAVSAPTVFQWSPTWNMWPMGKVRRLYSQSRVMVCLVVRGYACIFTNAEGMVVC